MSIWNRRTVNGTNIMLYYFIEYWIFNKNPKSCMTQITNIITYCVYNTHNITFTYIYDGDEHHCFFIPFFSFLSLSPNPIYIFQMFVYICMRGFSKTVPYFFISCFAGFSFFSISTSCFVATQKGFGF